MKPLGHRLYARSPGAWLAVIFVTTVAAFVLLGVHVVPAVLLATGWTSMSAQIMRTAGS
jgi:hypothetical protein